MFSLFRKQPVWIKSIIVTALLGVVGFFGAQVFPQNFGLKAWRWVEAAVRPQPKHDAFVILLADLSGDDADATNRKHLANVLTGMGGFRVVCIGKTLGEDPTVGDQTEARMQTAKEAQRLLAADGADILIWGKYYKDSFQLGLVPRVSNEASKTDPGLADYEIKTLTVPSSLAGQLGNLLELTIFTNIRPATEESGTYLVGKLRPLVPKLTAYLKGAKDLPADQMRVAWHSLGLANAMIGEQAGDNKALEQAIEAFGKALAVTPRETDPLNWATTQNSLGNALALLGERESGTKRLEKAVQAYQEALKERTRERVPLNWAATQNNLGVALQRLGERESGTERLEEAVLAYRKALKEYTRQRVSLDWAMTQNNLGNALRVLGERESGTERLQEAVRAYQEALKERTRERVPLSWAATQNNLGNALTRLGERESGTERLEEAVQAYHEALKERTRERVPLNWAATQNNLGRALLGLAKKGRDAAKAREALGHFEAAHEVFSQAAPYYREVVEGNMRNVQALIEELKKGQ